MWMWPDIRQAVGKRHNISVFIQSEVQFKTGAYAKIHLLIVIYSKVLFQEWNWSRYRSDLSMIVFFETFVEVPWRLKWSWVRLGGTFALAVSIRSKIQTKLGNYWIKLCYLISFFHRFSAESEAFRKVSSFRNNLK